MFRSHYFASGLQRAAQLLSEGLPAMPATALRVLVSADIPALPRDITSSMRYFFSATPSEGMATRDHRACNDFGVNILKLPSDLSELARLNPELSQVIKMHKEHQR